MTIAAAAARVALFDSLIKTRGRTAAHRRVYGNDTSGQLYRDRAAVAAECLSVNPAFVDAAARPRASAQPQRLDARHYRMPAGPAGGNSTSEELIEDGAPVITIAAAPKVDRVIAMVPERQYETPVTNPAATASAIVAAGDRARLGLGSSSPPALKLTGPPARIIAAGRHRRGETPALKPIGLADQIVAAGKKRRNET